MATLLNADLPSDDEEDETFEPGKAPGGGGGGKGGGRGAGKGAKRGFLEVSDGDNDDGAATAGHRHNLLAEGLADAVDDARYLCGAAAWHQSEAEPLNCDRRDPARLFVPPELVRGLPVLSGVFQFPTPFLMAHAGYCSASSADTSVRAALRKPCARVRDPASPSLRESVPVADAGKSRIL